MSDAARLRGPGQRAQIRRDLRGRRPCRRAFDHRRARGRRLCRRARQIRPPEGKRLSPTQPTGPKGAAIEERARFDFVRYANCWEDSDVLLKALAVKKGGNYL